jgi:hypothetical protein
VSQPRLLFRRSYRAFQGGHLKVADYIAHAQASALFTPCLFMSADSRMDHPFPRETLTHRWQPEAADALFVAGMDWAHVPPGLEESVPVINLIQHPRHALPDDPRFPFLRRRATRICVSHAVAEAVREAACACGPVLTIPTGLDLGVIPNAGDKSVDVLICGLKNPPLAQAVAGLLRAAGHHADVLTGPIPRDAYLAALVRARIAITLPDAAEGFYLPALEAMAAGCAVICPDALGNRAFCRNGDTCLTPAPAAQALANAALCLLAAPVLMRQIATAGQREARRFDLQAERAAFLSLLARIRPASARA